MTVGTLVVRLTVYFVAFALPTADAFPDANSTGLTELACPNWSTQATASDGFEVTEDGAVLSYLDVTGRIRIKARDVTLRCSRIDPSGSLYGIHCDSRDGGCPGLLVENVEVTGCDSACVLPAGTADGPVTLRRVHLHNTAKDLLKATSYLILEQSYLHGFNPAPGAHNDAIQTSGGSHIIIRGNRIEGPPQAQTSAYLVKPDFGPIRNIVIADNWLAGGNYTVYLRDSSSQPAPADVAVLNNTWAIDSWQFGPISSDTSASSCLEWRGNMLSDGTPLPAPDYANPTVGCAIEDISGLVFASGFEN